MRAKLVIFDCDGVLVDSEVLAAAVLARELTALGLPCDTGDCLDRYTGISMASVVGKIEADAGVTLPADFVARLRAADAEAFARELKPVAGAREMLAALSVPRCVASSGSLAKMQLTLGLTGLLPFLGPHLFSAEMVAHGKPAPDLFLYAASRMGVAPPACVVIEDSQPGVQAALAAGMRVFGFAGGGHCGEGYVDRLRSAGAPLVFDDLRKLPGLLGAL